MDTPEEELEELQEKGLRRFLRPISKAQHPEVRLGERSVLNFSSNDYLGFSQHPAVIEAGAKALRDYGAGSTASRLVCGSLDLFHQLEEQLAKAKKTETALTFANGYATAMGCLPALMGKGDTIILDKLAHACLIDAARLSEAQIRVFPHNDLNKLEKLLATSTGKKGRTLIVTESIFSMDGDLCPLPEIVALKKQYGALLWLDEAHAVGVLGATGQGLAELHDLQEEVDFQMGTCGKALGSAGGYLATSRTWSELFINKARSFIYSTAPPPAQAASTLAALTLMHSEEGLATRRRLQALAQNFDSQTPIIPWVIGENETAIAASERLLEQGFLVPAIRYPTVPRGTARLRITLSASHTQSQIDDLREALTKI